MFLSFNPQLLYYKTYIFWIISIIIWRWLFFITFIVRYFPYIICLIYVWGYFLIINIRYFISALLVNSGILMKFVHSGMITIFQANNSQTRKKNIEKYIAPYLWLIIMSVPICFDKKHICRNTVEFCRQYGGLKNFLHPRAYVNPHEISRHPSIISDKQTNFFCEDIEIYI